MARARGVLRCSWPGCSNYKLKLGKLPNGEPDFSAYCVRHSGRIGRLERKLPPPAQQPHPMHNRGGA